MVRIMIYQNPNVIEMTLERLHATPRIPNSVQVWGTDIPRLGSKMLRITVHEDETEMDMTLEGRLAGPWVAELSRAWLEIAPRLGQRKLCLDLSNVTYSDSIGKQVLRDIYAQTNAAVIAHSIWAEYLAEEIRNDQPDQDTQEPGHGFDA